jgi:hypothetical protein
MKQTEAHVEAAHQLREKAACCLRLAKSINTPSDIAFLEALAGKFIQEAEQREVAEAGTAGHVVFAASNESRARDLSSLPDPNLPVPISFVPNSRDTEPQAYASSDRRRPGRRNDASPVLIPLLREESIESLVGEPDDDSADNLRGSRGIIIWTLVSAAIWLPLLWWIGGLGR